MLAGLCRSQESHGEEASYCEALSMIPTKDAGKIVEISQAQHDSRAFADTRMSKPKIFEASGFPTR
jgi:hypothetical protein